MPGARVRVHECFITAVYAKDRLIDVQGERGANFRRISYLLPWITASGSGLDIVPQTGDKCLVLAADGADDGRGRLVVCIGFQVPNQSQGAGQQLGGRLESLPEGSVALRCLSGVGDEAMVLLTRGGTVLVSANDGCRTLYSPVDSSIIHIFNNWEMNGPGGHVRWSRKEGEKAVAYHSEYRVHTDGGLRVNVDINEAGSLQPPSPISVTVHNGDVDNPFLRVRVTADGEAFIEGEVINIVGASGIVIDAPEVKIKNRQVLGQGDPI